MSLVNREPLSNAAWLATGDDTPRADIKTSACPVIAAGDAVDWAPQRPSESTTGAYTAFR